MHLRPYPKLLRSELHLDAAAVQTSSQRSQQEVLRKKMSSERSSRSPLRLISTNTLCCGAPPSPTSRYHPTLGPCQNTAEDGDTTLNMWTVIKPGHVREKIAIFASEGRLTDGTEDGARGSESYLSRCNAAGMTCVSSGALSGQFRAVKAKGSWEENSSAKRRRRSLNNQKHQLDQSSRIMSEQLCDFRAKPRGSKSAGGPCGEAPPSAEQEQKVSVVDMVAFLEHRASELQPNLKPLLNIQRSCTTITLSKTIRPEIREGEEPEIVRVSEMVAKLESECLRSCETSLSRSNSLKRTVGRVLLAAGQKSFSPQPETSPVTKGSSSPSPSSPPEPLSSSENPISSSHTVRAEPPAAAAPSGVSALHSGDPTGKVSEETAATPPPPQSEEQEPLPGLLFLSPDETESNLCAPHHRTSFYLQPTLPPASPVISPLPQSEKNSRSAAVPLGRSPSASQDFLKVRQRLQQLLAPQSYLLLLPHHLLVNMFLLLPTQSLAALKCTCSYFKFIIENYGVRPADSLWVSDPRYRDDPCKQCKKRYCPGDVSLCRWHHKPYCQALPYGPGFWMCCHGAQRDAPGCNVGLHDNRWVPAFHSINVPIYKRNYSHES
ncbi:F-box only protein 34 [Cyprinodon tularosa]|uniref:F-box only protein 34 n=1 Tax=Cyprinodon tularosa TaxID=77115 RepID=UPI0018E209E4|nr:F-box only protein 34 [Cyprinodon tularosa]